MPVGLSVGALPHHQGGGEDAHAARPAGQHSEFYPHLGWQAARRSCPRYALAGSRSGSSTSWIVATSTLPAFMCCTKPGTSSSRVPSRTSKLIASIRAPTDRSTGIICDQAGRASTASGLPRTSAAHPLQGPRVRHAGLHHQQLLASGRHQALQKPWPVELFFKWIKQHLRIKQFHGTSENAVKTQIWIAVSVYVLAPSSRSASTWTPRSTLCYDPLGDPLRENAHASSTCGRRKQMQRFANNQPIEFIRFLTGH